MFEARRACQDVQRLTAHLDLRGIVAGRQVSRTMWAGVSVDGLSRLESASPSGRPFVLTASKRQALLLLPDRGPAYVRGDAAVLHNAVIGLALDGSALEAVLTGCPRISGGLTAEAFDSGWMRVMIDAKDALYLHRSGAGAAWEAMAYLHVDAAQNVRWRADFRDRGRYDGVPRTIRLTKLEWNSRASRDFDVTLRLTRIQVNPLLTPATFAPPLSDSMRQLPDSVITSSAPIILQ
jgi:hypothetical protein